METEVLPLVDQQIQLAMSSALNSLTQIMSNHSFVLRCRSSSRQRENRTFDVQYSFSLSQPWLTKVNQQQCYLNGIRTFADEFVEQSLQCALHQAGEFLELRFSKRYIYQ